LGISPPAKKSVIAGTAVAVENRAVLMIGPSGSGKSQIALTMISLGATLISDDQILVTERPGHLLVSPIDKTQGKIEARKFGIINVPFQQEAVLCAVLDLGKTETQRLPPHRTYQLMGHEFALYWGSNTPSLANIMMLLLKNAK